MRPTLSKSFSSRSPTARERPKPVHNPWHDIEVAAATRLQAQFRGGRARDSPEGALLAVKPVRHRVLGLKPLPSPSSSPPKRKGRRSHRLSTLLSAPEATIEVEALRVDPAFPSKGVSFADP